MEKKFEKIVAEYRQMYAPNFTGAPQRLPLNLVNEDDTRCRLQALYELDVENRGHVIKLDENTNNKITRVAHWLCSSKQRGLILMGVMGNGKSTMLHAISRLFNGRGSYGDAQDIFEHFKKSQGTMRFWDETLLLIDDLGIEPSRCVMYGEEYFPISRLLLHRYDKQLTTIIATNLSIEDIAVRYGDRVVERMKETYNVLKYESKSYR